MGQLAIDHMQICAADPAGQHRNPELEVSTDWVTSEPCPPRNGPGQNLAGMINDAPSMSETAIHACAYKPGEVSGAAGAESAADLIALYGPQVTGEVQRLRVNLTRQVHFALNTDTGYVQCEPQTKPDAIYCEAESTDSWPGLASVLTPDRMARLHAAGYGDPGRAPNYWKLYPLTDNTDAAIARELISLLHDSYGYVGAPPLDITTETDPAPADDQPTNDKP